MILCGILAYYSKQSFSESNIKDCISSLELIEHRGPNDKGIVLIDTINSLYKHYNKSQIIDNTILNEYSLGFNCNLILAHNRLSIIDLSTNAHQPMFFNNSWIVYNGEVYNYVELKKELIDLGYYFNSTSDTEVVLKAYHFWGKECIKKFNGMWSFVIWDGNKNKLFCSNDRFGVKPLYYLNNNNQVIFTSEIKQFKSFSNIELSINQKNSNLYISRGIHPLDNSTYYNEISRFPKSHTLDLDLKKEKLSFNFYKYYDLYNLPQKKIAHENAKFELKELLKNAISIRTRSDVNLGVSISGGIDSTLILQYLVQLQNGNKISTFSSITPGSSSDESYYINKVNDFYNTIPNYSNPIIEFEREDFNNFLKQIEFPPVTMSFYAQWLISRLMHNKNITINLVGQGADEIFGGYHTHYFRFLRYLIIKGKLISYFSELNAYSKIKGLNKINLHKIILSDLLTLFYYKSGIKKLDQRFNLERFSVIELIKIFKNDLIKYELPFFLHSDDRSSMGHSVETRHPFLDYRVVNFGYSLPNNLCLSKGWSKFILRNMIDNNLRDIKWRVDKKGFTTPFEDIAKNINGKPISIFDFRSYCFDTIFK